MVILLACFFPEISAHTSRVSPFLQAASSARLYGTAAASLGFCGGVYLYTIKSMMSDSLDDSDLDDAVPRALVICGPSGVGKGTLIDKLQKAHDGAFGFSVSHTTRNPRKGEEDGVHYNFTTVEAIKKEIAAGKFIEHAEVHGNFYGTSVAAIDKVSASGKICILDIDVQGCRAVRNSPLNALYVFISPPSMKELERRLRGRKTDSRDAIAKRLQNASGELEASKEPGLFDVVLVNNDLDTCFAQLEELLDEDIAALP